jgi:acyl-[acyl-carrier-protein]-phospholipid O-acyltransferase/long-chain-fatty-acid--[acyl-carrier-protein] ligase
VKIGGEMVSMVKVETEVIKLLPNDIECCVIEIPDPRKGARLVVVTTKEIDKSKIMKQLKDRLPVIAIPKIFMTLSELPKMGSGKIDFRGVTKAVRQKLMQH